jgi:hypothetical protein
VLEHTADEHAALAEWRLRLRPRGWLLASVPAGERRYGAADWHVGHYRRYETDRLAELLSTTGFEVTCSERVGLPLGYVLEPLRHLIARFTRSNATFAARTATSSSWLQPSDSAAWLTRAVTAPFRALECRLPSDRPGTDLIVLARSSPRRARAQHPSGRALLNATCGSL